MNKGVITLVFALAIILGLGASFLIINKNNNIEQINPQEINTGDDEQDQIKQPNPPKETDSNPTVQESSPTLEPTPGLIAHWTFDEHTTDEINKYPGLKKGNAEIQQGIIGNAISLDGDGDYIEFSQDALDHVGGLTQGSISFWFNYESLLDSQTVMPIFYIGNKQGNPDNLYIIEIGHSAGDGRTQDPDPNDKKIYSTWIKDNREPFLCFDSGFNMEENKWHHYTVVVGPKGNFGYINGRLLETADHNFGDGSAQSFLDSFQNKETFLLGYGRNSFMISPDFVYFKGLVDDLRIYDRPLEWIEVQELYDLGK